MFFIAVPVRYEDAARGPPVTSGPAVPIDKVDGLLDLH